MAERRSSLGAESLKPIWRSVLIAIGLLGALFSWAPFFTHDSFHYMQLGIRPVLGDSHPPGFGFYLRGLGAIGEFLGVPVFGLNLYMVIQIVLLSLLFAAMVPRVSFLRVGLLGKTSLLILLTASVALLWPALWIIKNAVWTEVVYLFFVLLAAWILRASQGVARFPRILFLMALLALSFFLNYEVRHQAAILPIAAVLALAIGGFHGKAAWKSYLMGMVALLGILGGLLLTPPLFLERVQHAESMTRTNLETSFLCALRCEASSFQEACRDPIVRRQIEEPTCSEVALGVRPFPVTRKGYAGIRELVAGEGLGRVVKWLFKAPLWFLLEQHKIWGLEVGRFRFADDDGTKAYPEANEYFRHQFDDPRGTIGSFNLVLVEYLTQAHFTYWVFNIWAGIMVAMSGLLIFFSRRLDVLFLSFVVLGTLCVFGFVAVHTPFRFLVQLVVLGMLAWAFRMEEIQAGSGSSPPRFF